jgi:homocitrate synthase NifV
MSGPAILSQVLPAARLSFDAGIDLMDETLREGAERATVPSSLAGKAELAEAIVATGVRTLVVGMFPDVPHNIELLKELISRQAAGRIPDDVRFMIISHVGITFEQTLEVLAKEHIPLRSVWIIVIHSVSDLQMRHLFPTVLKKDVRIAVDDAAWGAKDDDTLRADNLQWFDNFLPALKRFDGGGIMVGLLDAFRAEQTHLVSVCRLLAKHQIPQVRLVDTAGTCLPHQLEHTVGALVRAFPEMRFFGHFHDDFGMATANAIVGLSLGLKGVDVSVGGFANRAGHPPLAEVAMALRQLYGVELPGFQYGRLYALSRQAEQLYGLMENPAQAISGVITYSIQSGIRTELLARAPTIFDTFDPAEIGSSLIRMFGVRSGRDGLLRFLKASNLLAAWGVEASADVADRIYPALHAEWQRRSARTHDDLRSAITAYQRLLNDSFFTEEDVRSWLQANPQLIQTSQGNR